MPPKADEKVPFWKKDISLGGRKKEPKPPEAAEATEAEGRGAGEGAEAAPREGAQGAEGQGGEGQQGREAYHRPEDRRVATRGRACRKQRQRRAAAGRARAARAGDRRRRRVARPGRARGRAQGFLRQAQAPEEGRAPRHRQQPHRRPHFRDRRDRRIRSSSATRSGSARRKCCRSRSTRLCSTTRFSAKGSTRRVSRLSASCSSSRTASSSTGMSTRARRPASTLGGIDLEAFALLRALQPPQEGVGSDPTAALVAVAIGHERSTFAVSDGRVCEFTRVLEWGGSALNVAIARALNAAPSEVEDVKRALSLTERHVPEVSIADQAKRARGGDAQGDPDVRARARVLAPVLPEPARLAGHRRRSFSPAGPRTSRDSPASSSA